MTNALYILRRYGEIVHSSPNIEEVLERTREAFEDHLARFYSPRPFRVTPEDVHQFDIDVFKLTDDIAIVLPFQDWADEYYNDRDNELLSAEEAEYRRYLCLRNKWEARRLADETQSRSRTTNPDPM